MKYILNLLTLWDHQACGLFVSCLPRPVVLPFRAFLETAASAQSTPPPPPPPPPPRLPPPCLLGNVFCERHHREPQGNRLRKPQNPQTFCQIAPQRIKKYFEIHQSRDFITLKAHGMYCTDSTLGALW